MQHDEEVDENLSLRQSESGIPVSFLMLKKKKKQDARSQQHASAFSSSSCLRLVPSRLRLPLSLSLTSHLTLLLLVKQGAAYASLPGQGIRRAGD